MKKTLAFMLALVLMLALAVPAMAATITVPNDALETYTYYKIFDVTKTGDNSGYAYTLAANSEWVSVLFDTTNNTPKQDYFTLTLSADGSVYNVSATAAATGKGEQIADWLLDNKGSIAGTNLAIGENTVDNGYYLITSTKGSNLVLATTNITVVEKNDDYPSITKAVDKEYAQIGDTITYTMTLTVPAYADKPVVVHDYMEDGLTLKNTTLKAIVKDSDPEVAVPYTYAASERANETFTLTFSAAAVAGKTVVITYQAELDKDAEIVSDTNQNSAWITYSEYESTKSTVETKSLKFELQKVVAGSTTDLSGAEFELYDTQNGETPIELVKVSDGNYRVADSTETTGTVTVIEVGSATISGLDNITYYLEETKAPAGYNKLTTRVAVAFNGANLVGESKVTVENSTGSELPSTGGMGTTLFYVIGSLMMAAAVVILVARKKVAAK